MKTKAGISNMNYLSTGLGTAIKPTTLLHSPLRVLFRYVTLTKFSVCASRCTAHLNTVTKYLPDLHQCLRSDIVD